MKNICKLCGTYLDENEEVCPLCGTVVDDSVQEEPRGNSGRGKRKLIIVITTILVVLVGGALGHTGYKYISEQQERKEKAEHVEELKEAAKEVVNLIDSIEETDNNSIDDLLREIQIRYNSLSREEKTYVTNYSTYKEAYDRNIAKKFDGKIMNVSITTYEETTKIVQSLRSEYENLTDGQKSYVENLDNLDTYEAMLEEIRQEEAEESARAEAEKAEEEKIASLWKVVKNFREFNGKWGDFGAHINSYQGEIESAIKASIDLSDYFQGAPNDLTMWASSFTYTYGGDVSSAWTYVTFEGTLTTGEEGWLSGEIVVQNGEFVYTEIWTSQDLQ